jgi:hypothetical protein
MPPKRTSRIPPLAIFFLVSFLYAVYLVLHLLPQLARLNYLQPPALATGRKYPEGLSWDPHLAAAPIGEVVALSVSLHLALALFAAAYYQAMVTDPGSVPEGDKRWEQGVFDIDPQDEEKLDAIIKDKATDLTQVRARRVEIFCTHSEHASAERGCELACTHACTLSYASFNGAYTSMHR